MVLLVVLIMLVVIGLVSAAAMRGALTSDQISNNARLENIAKQAAQIALRYCENGLTNGTIPAQPSAADGVWSVYSNWSGGPIKATTVPEDFMKNSNSDGSLPKNLPQCLAENSSFDANVKIVTARGFGPDYDTATSSGAVVWLQSVVKLSSPSTPPTGATP